MKCDTYLRIIRYLPTTLKLLSNQQLKKRFRTLGELIACDVDRSPAAHRELALRKICRLFQLPKVNYNVSAYYDLFNCTRKYR